MSGRRLGTSLFVLAFAQASLSAAAPDPAGGTGGVPLTGTLTVRVVTADPIPIPIPGAFVMAGTAQNAPFTSNIAFTDGAGAVSFTNPALAGSITVTAGATGRAYVTLYDLGTSELVLPLPVIDPLPTARLGDQFGGIEVANGVFCLGDGNLDFGFVIPAIPIDDALAGGASLALATVSEPLTTPQGPVAVPSNLYFPRQCELTQYYEKSSYHLRVTTGRRSLFGLTARVPILSFLNAQNIVDLIQAMSFRELDVLRDLTIAANSDAADLAADLPLAANLTLQVTNGQPGTQVIAASGGRITANDGAQELVLTGVGAFDPDVDGSSATLGLTTRPSTGELSDLIHAALVTQSRDTESVGNGRGSTTALLRSGFVPPATLSFGSFFDIVEVSSLDDASFFWTNVVSGSSPASRDLNTSRLIYQKAVPNPDDPLATVNESRTYWILYTPGGSPGLTLPVLPLTAPTAIPAADATPANDRVDFAHSVAYFGDDPDGFQYDSFALRDAGRYGTHVSANERPLVCSTRSEIAGLTIGKGTNPGEVVLTWSPSADYCHDTLSGTGYEVYAAATPRPSVAPGAWPTDPLFDLITANDIDGSLTNAGFTHVPPDGFVVYLVVDRGLSGNEGPAGHYGSLGP